MSKTTKADLKKIEIDEFVRKFKNVMDQHNDARFVFFVGAGCSLSSGIPIANALVKTWLPRLKKLKTGSEDHVESWAKTHFDGYKDDQAALFYGKVMDELFNTPEERLRELEKLLEGKEPGFGYAVLAQMMAHEKYGRQCNVALTTNFDDLLADSFYLFTHKKPAVFYQEALGCMSRMIRTRPVIIKLRGDAHLNDGGYSPHAAGKETIMETIRNLVSGSGVVFIGCGGNEESVTELMENLPESALPWGVYWISDQVPDNNTGAWLKKRNASWVNHLDFDEMMLLIWNAFNLNHPDEKRFKDLVASYFMTFEKFKKKIEKQPDKETTKALTRALVSAVKKSQNWWGVEQEADSFKRSDPEKTDIIYQAGLGDFPKNSNLMALYAIFLTEYKHDVEKAEEYFRRALALDPGNPHIIQNFGVFLARYHKNYHDADRNFQRAIQLEPNHERFLASYAYLLSRDEDTQPKALEYFEKANRLNPYDIEVALRYARFLMYTWKEHTLGEKLYKQCIDMDSGDGDNMFRYRFFLKNIRKNPDIAILYFDKFLKLSNTPLHPLVSYANMAKDIRGDHNLAQQYYERAMQQSPDDPVVLANYGGFLLGQGKPHGFDMLRRTVQQVGSNRYYDYLLLECLFYQYAHAKDPKVQHQALERIKKYLWMGVRSPGWNPSDNIKRAVEDQHPYSAFLIGLSKVISDQMRITELDGLGLPKDGDKTTYMAKDQRTEDGATRYMECAAPGRPAPAKGETNFMSVGQPGAAQQETKFMNLEAPREGGVRFLGLDMLEQKIKKEEATRAPGSEASTKFMEVQSPSQHSAQGPGGTWADRLYKDANSTNFIDVQVPPSGVSLPKDENETRFMEVKTPGKPLPADPGETKFMEVKTPDQSPQGAGGTWADRLWKDPGKTNFIEVQAPPAEGPTKEKK